MERSPLGTSRGIYALAAALTLLLPAFASADSMPIAFSGDLRYRHENTWLETGNDAMRHRIRMRFGAKAQVSDDLSVTMRISTAGSAPTSTNETLENAFNRKPLGIDLAYIAWTPFYEHSGILSRGQIWAGKMKRPFYRPGGSQLFWDSDVTPEGIAVVVGEPKGTTSGLFVNAGMYWIDEAGGDNDMQLYAAQAGPKFQIGDAVTATVGGGYYYYTGNSIVWWSGIDYELAEAFADISVDIGDRSFQMFGHFARNMAADDATFGGVRQPADDTGWLAGFRIDDAPVSLTYIYRRVEANAVLPLFTDSDFASGADCEGHVVALQWKVRRPVTLGVTAYAADIGLDSPKAFSRLQADIIVAF